MAIATIVAILTVALVVRIICVVRYNNLLQQAERYMRKGADKIEDAEWSEYSGDFEAAHRNYRRAARRFAKLGDRTMARHCVKMAQEADKGLSNAWY